MKKGRQGILIQELIGCGVIYRLKVGFYQAVE